MPGDDVITSGNKGRAERFPPYSTAPYSVICLFEDTGEVLLFIERNCNVSISVRFMANKMHAVSFVLDTDAGPILIRVDLLKAECLRGIQPTTGPALKNAANQKVSVFGENTLQVRMEASKVRVALVVYVAYLPQSS